MRARRLACLAVFGLIPLSGCTLLHSNIKGGFACAAPRGTCAPSMAIDDAAISAMGRQAKDKPTRDPGAEDTKLPEADRNRVFIGTRPALRVVYPPWRDASGQFHPRTATYVPVDAPGLVRIDVAPLDGAKLDAGRDRSLLAIAELAPDQSLLAAPTPITQGDASPAVVTTPGTRTAGATTSVTPEQAKAVPTGAGPLDAIRKQVTDILRGAPRPPAAAPAAPPAPGNVAGTQNTGGSFPPAGN